MIWFEENFTEGYDRSAETTNVYTEAESGDIADMSKV